MVINPAPPDELLDIIIEILNLPSVRIVSPGFRHAEIMKRFFKENGAQSRLTTDVHLAALAVEHDAVLVSNDADFARFSGLKLMNPI